MVRGILQGTVTIHPVTPDVPVTIFADIVNQYFAVHPRYKSDAMWTVTHIPSGLALLHTDSQDKAIAAARAALANTESAGIPVSEWGFIDYQVPQSVYAIGWDIVRAYRTI